MRRYRYMVVHYPHSVASNLGIKDGRFVNHLPIHELLHEYHWVRLDDTHVIVTGEYSIGFHKAISEHPHTLMLPSVGSNKKLLQHGIDSKKHAHAKALLAKFNLDETHTMADMLDRLEEFAGPLFLPVR